MLSTILNIALYVSSTYFGLVILYQFALAVGSKFERGQVSNWTSNKSRFLVLVPAYKEDVVVINSATKNVNVDYPSQLFEYVVIADQLKEETIYSLKSKGINVLRVAFEQSTKVKSLQAALLKYGYHNYDGVVILDADNVMSNNFLNEANRQMQSGKLVIQSERVASNLNTTAAVFDAISEKANNEIVCKGANYFSLSSKLSGSGMIFKSQLFGELIKECKAIGGFDKELELKLTQRRIFIHYSDLLNVKDEKIGSYNDMSKQRSRWLQAQYNYFKNSINEIVPALVKGHFDHVHKILQLALPPRALIAVGLLPPVIIYSLNGDLVSVLVLLSLMAMNALTYFILIPRQWLLEHGSNLIMELPRLIIAACKALVLMPKAKKKFIHTVHTNKI